MVDVMQVKLRYAAYAEAGGETTIDAADAAQIVELCEMAERAEQAARDAVRLVRQIATYTVILEAPDGLAREHWRFYVVERSIGVSYWANEQRETRRHKWKPNGDTFDRTFRNRSSMTRPPTPTQSVLDALRAQMIERADATIRMLASAT